MRASVLRGGRMGTATTFPNRSRGPGRCSSRYGVCVARGETALVLGCGCDRQSRSSTALRNRGVENIAVADFSHDPPGARRP